MHHSLVPHLWQRDLFRTFSEVFSHPAQQVIVIKSRRQVGKSLSIIGCMLHSICNSEWKVFGYYAPTIKQARHTFMEIVKFSYLYNLQCTLDFNKSILTITCNETHSSIEFGSLGTGDAVRGNTYSGVIVDECAFCDDDSIQLLYPMLDVEMGWFIAVSTPWHRTGTFWELFNDPKSIVFDWTTYDMSSVLTDERLAFYKRTMRPSLYKTDIEGNFLDDGESVIYGNIASCISKEAPDYHNEPLVIGIDAASGKNDYNAITAFFLRDGIAYELFTHRFCNTEVRDNVAEFYSYITQYANQVKCVMFETNNVGLPMMQSLKDRLRANGYHSLCSKIREDYWTATSKGSAIADSVLWFNTESIRLHSDILVRECCSYTEFVNPKTGAITFGNAHQGNREEHDDCWCSALHALSGLRKGTTMGRYTIG